MNQRELRKKIDRMVEEHSQRMMNEMNQLKYQIADLLREQEKE